jgi:hypothetical protein
MKKIKTTALIAMAICAASTLAISVGCGCKSVTTVSTDSNGNSVTNVTKTLDVARASSIAKQAATIATEEVLKAQPQLRPQFELAESDLRTLATSPSIGLQDILNIAERLPIKDLQSQDARYAFEGATIILAGLNIPDLPADKAAKLQPIALAIADGIAMGMAEVPTPAPTSAPPATPLSK